MTRGEQLDIFSDVISSVLPGCKIVYKDDVDAAPYTGHYIAKVDCGNHVILLAEIDCENMNVIKIWSPW